MALPPKARTKLDDDTIASVEILNEAVKDVRVPGGMEYKVVTGALERVVASGNASDLAIAEAAFDRLDGAVKEGIAERAYDRAEDHRRAAVRGDGPAVAKSVQERVAERPTAPSPGSTEMRAPSRPPPRANRPAVTGMPLIDAMSGALRRRP